MKTTLLSVGAALFVFLFFLIAGLPAQQVLNRLDPGPNINMQQISGTIWHGSMARLTINGMPVNNLNWEINPFGLLLGRISAAIDAGNIQDADAITINGHLAVALSNFDTILSDDLLVYVPTNRVLAQVALPIPVNASGRFRLRFEELDFGPACGAMQGWGDWLNASVGGTRGPITLGNFSAEISCDGDNIKLQVTEPNSLGLSFVSRFSADLSDFSLAGKFKPSPDLPQEVHQASRFFGSPGADGYTVLEL